jgi:hypothetical protein
VAFEIHVALPRMIYTVRSNKTKFLRESLPFCWRLFILFASLHNSPARTTDSILTRRGADFYDSKKGGAPPEASENSYTVNRSLVQTKL